MGEASQWPSAISHLVQRGVVNPGGVSVSLLTSIQRAHDDSYNWYGGKFTGFGSLRNVARSYGLTFPEEPK